MPRSINATLLSLFQSDVVNLYFAVKLEFDSGDLRVWSGLGDKTILSESYTGTGSLLSVSGMGESSDFTAQNATIQLAGIDPSIISTALSEPYQNRTGTIYLGSLDTPEPLEIFSGLMDVMNIYEDGETATISLTLESYLLNLDRNNVLRYTQESQEALFTGDTFLSFVSDLQDKDIPFGRELVDS